MSRPPDIDALSAAELRVLVVEHMSRVGDLSAVVIELRAEIARLKGLKERPDIKPPSTPSGMGATSSKPEPRQPKRPGFCRFYIHRCLKNEEVADRTGTFTISDKIAVIGGAQLAYITLMSKRLSYPA